MSRFDSCADVERFIKGMEDESQARFITLSVDRHYNDKDWQPLPVNRVYWQWAGGSGMPAIDFTGIPFMFVGSKRLVCHQGKDLAVAQKQRYAEERAKKMILDSGFGSQRSARETKKVGCPAAISISKIATFPKFKVEDNSERSKKTASKLLRGALERDPIVWRTSYAVSLPGPHAGHTPGDAFEQETSRRRRRRMRRKTDLRKKCLDLARQIADRINVTEDRDALEELSEKLSALLGDLAEKGGAGGGGGGEDGEDGAPLHLQVKRVRVSSAILTLSQRTEGRSPETQEEWVLIQEAGGTPTKRFPVDPAVTNQRTDTRL